MKIIFITEIPFTERDWLRYGIDRFLANNFSVEIWQVTPIIRPQLHAKIGFTALNKVHILFSSYNSLKAALSEASDSFFILNVLYDRKTYNFFSYLKKIKASFCVLSRVSLFTTLPLKDKWRVLLQRLNLNYLFDKLFQALPTCILSLPHASCALLLGGERVPAHRLIGPHTHLIPAHDFDYDNYLRFLSEHTPDCENFAVFLDQYVPYHSDLANSGLKPIDPHEYYSQLNVFFDEFEKHTGCTVSIAAHPKADYSTQMNIFNGRQFFSNQTIDLVARCKAVILHDSSALSYAVLFNKPMVFITTDSILAGQGTFSTRIAEYFNSRIINIDSDSYSFDDVFQIKFHEYEKYKRQYLKSVASPDRISWDLLIDHLHARLTSI